VVLLYFLFFPEKSFIIFERLTNSMNSFIFVKFGRLPNYFSLA
jgi:hypothetical protein